MKKESNRQLFEMTDRQELPNGVPKKKNGFASRFPHGVYFGSYVDSDIDKSLKFLLTNYKNSDSFRKTVNRYERKFVARSEQSPDDYIVIYHLTDLSSVNIVQKLCDYYLCNWFYCPSHGKFKFTRPDSDPFKPSIQDISVSRYIVNIEDK
ncbi:hypothetical protein RF11_02949 [Thelohanellus kitauei]|uniref:Uncharacterized protein n=1 Tax=Thelohanellus kitauei TaxID=669202 RepID=A0A0C2JPX8_THEKT|nr:hypothetical protein RF11_02949 [Thelohanellus kitauei]